MIKGKPINVAMIVAWISSIRSFFIMCLLYQSFACCQQFFASLHIFTIEGVIVDPYQTGAVNRRSLSV